MFLFSGAFHVRISTVTAKLKQLMAKLYAMEANRIFLTLPSNSESHELSDFIRQHQLTRHAMSPGSSCKAMSLEAKETIPTKSQTLALMPVSYKHGSLAVLS